jgi:hypothetical protein
MSTTTNLVAGATLAAALVVGGIALSPDDAAIEPGTDAGQLPEEPMKYFVATDDADIVHYGSYNPETQQLTTTQPQLDIYDTEAEMAARLAELDVQYGEHQDGGQP